MPRAPEAELMAHPGQSPRLGGPLETQARLQPILSFVLPLLLCHFAPALKPGFVSAW